MYSSRTINELRSEPFRTAILRLVGWRQVSRSRFTPTPKNPKTNSKIEVLTVGQRGCSKMFESLHQGGSGGKRCSAHASERRRGMYALQRTTWGKGSSRLDLVCQVESSSPRVPEVSFPPLLSPLPSASPTSVERRNRCGRRINRLRSAFW